jgi:hypothetical protein
MRANLWPEPNPRDEALFHLKWILDCLDAGAVAKMDQRRFESLFGSLGASAFEAARDLARQKGCSFGYDATMKTAMFQRVPLTCCGVIQWPLGEHR